METLIRELASQLGVATTELVGMYARQWPAEWLWPLFFLLATGLVSLCVRSLLKREKQKLTDRAENPEKKGEGSEKERAEAFWILVTCLLVSIFGWLFMSTIYTALQATLSPEAWAISRIVEDLK